MPLTHDPETRPATEGYTRDKDTWETCASLKDTTLLDGWPGPDDLPEGGSHVRMFGEPWGSRLCSLSQSKGQPDGAGGEVAAVSESADPSTMETAVRGLRGNNAPDGFNIQIEALTTDFMSAVMSEEPQAGKFLSQAQQSELLASLPTELCPPNKQKGGGRQKESASERNSKADAGGSEGGGGEHKEGEQRQATAEEQRLKEAHAKKAHKPLPARKAKATYTLQQLAQMTRDHESFVFCMQKLKLLPNEMYCERCRQPCEMHRRSGHDGLWWKCNCDSRSPFWRSSLHGSFFSNAGDPRNSCSSSGCTSQVQAKPMRHRPQASGATRRPRSRKGCRR